MDAPTSIFLGSGESPSNLLLKYANRHGLIAGATGTGKTVTLETIAQSLSQSGVPVFVADVKGDLSGLAAPGGGNAKVEERLKSMALPTQYVGCPAIYWDIFGDKGHAIRATVTEMGPLLLSRLMDLNDTQEGVLNIAFRIADEQGLLLLDLKDLRAILQYISDNDRDIQVRYGNVSAGSVGAIQRQLLVLEQQGADKFFAEPALDLNDFIRCDPDGQGFVNILVADRLMASPRLYSTFLLWLMSELFEVLPEAGDLDKPKLVFFFDEAHLLFSDAPKALLEKIEQLVRLIRSKGVGVYFVTQNPIDIPDTVLGQLGNKVQHALRAFTPRDQKAARVAADTFRANPKVDTATAILELATGEALVSVLDEKGVPTIVDRVMIRPPLCRLAPITEDERAQVQSQSPFRGKYDTAVDRESAYEILMAKAGEAAQAAETAAAQAVAAAQAKEEAKAQAKADAEAEKQNARLEREQERIRAAQEKEFERQQRAAEREAERRAREAAKPSAIEKTILNATNSAMRSAGSQLGRTLVRGILGGLLRR